MGDHMNWWGLLSTVIAGLAIFWVQRQALSADKERDKLDSRMAKLEDRLLSVERTVLADIPNKEDYRDMNKRLDSFEAYLHEVRDIVLRMEAIAKAR